MVKLGMIGVGNMGGNHAGALVNVDGVEIVGCCDLVEERAKKAAEVTGSEACADFRELLPKVDAVWICTEPFNRREIVVACAEAGKHIFTEKPVCDRIEDAVAMVDAAEKAGVKYMLGYCLRFWQPYRTLHQVFASGELGELVECWTRRYMPWVPERWYADQEKSGGVMGDFGSHDIDLLCWIGGAVKTVFAHSVRVSDAYTAHDHAGWVFVFEKGGVAMTSVSWTSRLAETSLGIVGTKGAIIAERDGTVRKKLAGGEEEIVDTQKKMGIDPEGHRTDSDEKGAAAGDLEEGLHAHFFRCIEEDATPRVTGREGLEDLRIVEALKESARTGRAVDIKR